MIIYDFDFFRPAIRPVKANTPLIVNANAVLTGAISLERFETVAGRRPQIIQPISDFKLSEFAPRDLGNACEPTDRMAF